MTNEDLQALLGAMLESGEGVSDCLFINGKPPLVERYGKLHELPMEEAGAKLHPTHINAMADLLLGESERLRADLVSTGSCDTSYTLGRHRPLSRQYLPPKRLHRHCHAQIAIGNPDDRIVRVTAHF